MISICHPHMWDAGISPESWELECGGTNCVPRATRVIMKMIFPCPPQGNLPALEKYYGFIVCVCVWVCVCTVLTIFSFHCKFFSPPQNSKKWTLEVDVKALFACCSCDRCLGQTQRKPRERFLTTQPCKQFLKAQTTNTIPVSTRLMFLLNLCIRHTSHLVRFSLIFLKAAGGDGPRECCWMQCCHRSGEDPRRLLSFHLRIKDNKG